MKKTKKHSAKAIQGLKAFVNEEVKEKNKPVKLVPPSKGHKPKGAHGRAAVKALGRTKTTGNFARIAKAKGKGAAIAAYQNALSAHKGTVKKKTIIQKASEGFQNVGKKMRDNYDKSQKDWKEGRMPYYGTANLTKGTGEAFKSAFKKKATVMCKHKTKACKTCK